MEYIDTLWEKYESSEEREKKKKEKQLDDKRWAIVSIASIPLVMTLGNSMLIPILPTMEKELDITSFQSSLIITVYSVVAILFIPIAGYLSDRLGRKKVIIPSLLLTAIGGAIAAFSSWQMQSGYWLVLIGRTLQGVGAAGAFPIVLPLVGDMFRSKEKVSSSLGIIETANTLGKVLSPILGSLLASIIWFLPFVTIPIFCTISIFMMIFLV
ncbi:MFS transporter, partial [Bacillus andreraoultii]